MALALFDLDQTLLAGDSDHLWGEFLAEQGLVNADEYRQANDRFYKEYKQGRLNIDEFLNFSLRPLSQYAIDDLKRWRRQFMAEKIEPLIRPPALKLVQKHQQKGDLTVLITATNSFVTAPIAQRFGIAHLIATEPEIQSGRYTGRVSGLPCFQEGKVKKLSAWLKDRPETIAQAWFYSDSHNDLPLLNRVAHPVAVNPDEILKKIAQKKHWPILSLY